MSRPIQFRAWDAEEEGMHYFDIGDAVSTGIDFWDDDAPLMQFTGLLDKNGKEIYEGDFVMRQNGKYIWKWEVGTVEGFGNNLYLVLRYRNFNANEEFGYTIGDHYFTGSQGRDELIGAERHLEVIGNIYEHPHLLSV